MSESPKFAFALRDRLVIACSGEAGTVIARSEYVDYAAPQYLLRYKAADGRATDAWWPQSALEREAAQAPADADAGAVKPTLIREPYARHAVPAGPQPLLYEHADGRRLVALGGNTIVAGDPEWVRFGPIDIDPALLPPRVGHRWAAQGGLYAGIARGAEGQPDHHLILAETAPDGALPWQAAVDWAAGLHLHSFSDWSLPTRAESALLYANLRGFFSGGWHWTGETHADDGSYAWLQTFYDGSQYYDHKSYEGRARAVRRLVLQSFGA